MIPQDWVTQVDSKGDFVRWVSRAQADNLRLMHRSVVVLIYNQHNQLLVQQRSNQKKTQPLHWDTSVSGFVDYEDHPNGDPQAAQEAFYNAAHRELKEELGVSCKLTKLAEYSPCKNVHIEQMAVFLGFFDGSFSFDPLEVSAISWINEASWGAIHPKTKQLEWLYEKGILWSNM
mgnify:CR=1 FL=1